MEKELAASSQQKRLRVTLLARLLDAVKQVQEKFGRGAELATESSNAVTSLLAQLEGVFAHGLRRSLTGPALDSIKHLTERVTRLKLDSLSSNDLNLWLLVRCVLSETETVRFLRLGQISTDTGRGRAWLRCALNERSLASALAAILGNEGLLREFYEEEAFLRDDELTATLPQVAQGLCSVVFALSIDDAGLNSQRCSSVEVADDAPQDAPTPVMAVSTRRAPSAERKKKRKPLVNLVSFNESSRRRFSETDGSMKVIAKGSGASAKGGTSSAYRRDGVAVVEEPAEVHLAPLPLAAAVQHSPSGQPDSSSPGPSSNPTTCPGPSTSDYSAAASNGAAAGSAKDSVNSLLLESWAKSHPGLTRRSMSEASDASSCYLTASGNQRGFVEELSAGSAVQRTPESTSVETPEVFLDEAGGAPKFPMLSPSAYVYDDDKASVSSSKVSSSADLGAAASVRSEGGDSGGGEVDALKGELALLKRRNADLKAGYEARLREAGEESELLRHQIKGYMEAVTALNAESDGQPSLYEEKLVQVAQMHAELSEFNEHLQRSLNRKRARVRKLRAELQNLRGPMAEDYSEDEAPCPAEDEKDARVDLWIPSYFQTGKGTDVHHVYQVYIRIGGCEWNVYRRYRDFHRLRKLLGQECGVAALAFPPKKALAKKDKDFVQQRRKDLESWLRSAVNAVVAEAPEFSAVPLNRDTLSRHLPFFKD